MPLRAAVLQFSPGPHLEANLECARQLAVEAAQRGYQLLLLPETCTRMGAPPQESDPARLQTWAQELTTRYPLTLILGSTMWRDELSVAGDKTGSTMWRDELSVIRDKTGGDERDLQGGNGLSAGRRAGNGLGAGPQDENGLSAGRRAGNGLSAGRQDGNGLSAGPRDGNGFSAGWQDGNGLGAGPQDGNGLSAGRQDGNGLSAGRQDGHEVSAGLKEKGNKVRRQAISLAEITYEARSTAVLKNRVGVWEGGVELGGYDKIHLFDCEWPGAWQRESDHFVGGRELVCIDLAAPWRVGLSICYDLRFPELYRRLVVDLGANILAVSAAFTAPTGRAHWELLVRARAVENQSYLLASNQSGWVDGVERYGHSMIVDPWGEVMARVEEECGWAGAELDWSHLQLIRSKLPALANRRL